MGILESLGIKLSILVAGIVGGITSLIKFTDMDTIPMSVRILSITSGTAIAVYVTPIVCHLLNIMTNELERGIAFMLGILGMEIAIKVVKVLKHLDFASILKKLVPLLAETENPKNERVKETDSINTESRQ